MELITIKIGLRDIEVFDGKLPRAKLGYTAPGLHIYTLGAIPVKMRDKVHYHAMNAALCRHIPLVSLKRHGAI